MLWNVFAGGEVGGTSSRAAVMHRDMSSCVLIPARAAACVRARNGI